MDRAERDLRSKVGADGDGDDDARGGDDLSGAEAKLQRLQRNLDDGVGVGTGLSGEDSVGQISGAGATAEDAAQAVLDTVTEKYPAGEVVEVVAEVQLGELLPGEVTEVVPGEITEPLPGEVVVVDPELPGTVIDPAENAVVDSGTGDTGTGTDSDNRGTEDATDELSGAMDAESEEATPGSDALDPTDAEITPSEPPADSSATPSELPTDAENAAAVPAVEVEVSVQPPPPPPLIRTVAYGILGLFGFDPTAPNVKHWAYGIFALYREIEPLFYRDPPTAANGALPNVTVGRTVDGDLEVSGRVEFSGTNGDPLAYTSTDGEHGTVTVAANGKFTYTPTDPNFTGTDTFTVTARNTGWHLHGLTGRAQTTATITVDLAGSSTPSPTITDHIRPGMPNENGESTGSFLYTSPDGKPPTIRADYNEELGTVEWDLAEETTNSVRVHYTHTRNPDYDGPPTVDTVVMTVEGIDESVTFAVQIAAAGQPAELSVIDSLSWETDPSDGSIRGSIIVKGAEDPRELDWFGESGLPGDQVELDLYNIKHVDENTWEVGITYVPSQETREQAAQTPGGLPVPLVVTAHGRYGPAVLIFTVHLDPAEDSASPITDHIQPGEPDENGLATGSFLYTGADGEGLSFDYSELEHGGAVEFDIQPEAEGWRVHYTYTPDREFAHSLAHEDYQGGPVTEAFAITVTKADGTVLPALDVEVPVTPVNTAPTVVSPQDAVLLGVISPDLSIHLRMVVLFDDPDGDEFEVVEVTAASGRDVHLLGVEEVGGGLWHLDISYRLGLGGVLLPIGGEDVVKIVVSDYHHGYGEAVALVDLPLLGLLQSGAAGSPQAIVDAAGDPDAVAL